MAQGTVTTVRLPPEDLKRLAKLAKELEVDRSALIRRALDAGVREILVEEAVRKYQRGGASAWFCARGAGVNLLVFLDELKVRGVPFRTDEDLLREQVEELIRARRGR
ncbi:MAG TPA: ribbon-helix-helix protein, CopG family [Candidatus Thermoplasmatota archaeon]|nr:ribbon-helix-helix protein, CopG family [Candidatus Thermoplasmatota archaeon]